MEDFSKKIIGWYAYQTIGMSPWLEEEITQLRKTILQPQETQIDLEQKAEIIRRMIDVLYSIPGCECGGGLHVVVDDLNVDDSNLKFCVNYVLTESSCDSHRGIALAILYDLSFFTEQQRLNMLMHRNLNYFDPNEE